MHSRPDMSGRNTDMVLGCRIIMIASRATLATTVSGVHDVYRILGRRIFLNRVPGDVGGRAQHSPDYFMRGALTLHGHIYI